MHTETIRMSVYASLMAAFIAVGAYIAIPIGPVPIVLQNLFVLLTGLLLGSRWGLAAVGLYLLAGACGLPVFAGGQGGIGRLLGPTGGYLLSYLPAVFVIGRINAIFGKGAFIDVIGMLCATAITYTCGVSWLKVLTGMTWYKAVAVGMLPFLIGDALKIAAAVPLAKALRPVMNSEGIRPPAVHKTNQT